MLSKRSRIIAFIIFLLSLFLATPLFAQAYIGVAPANPDPEVKFSDSWFVYNLRPGEEKEDAMIVNNHSKNIITVKVFPVEAEINAQETFVTNPEKEVEQGISKWVKVSHSEIKMGPGESQKVEFLVKPPQDIEQKQ